MGTKHPEPTLTSSRVWGPGLHTLSHLIGTVIGLPLATFSFPTLVSPLSRVPLDHQCLPTLTHYKQDPRQTSLKLAAIARQDAHEGGGAELQPGRWCSLATSQHQQALTTSQMSLLSSCLSLSQKASGRPFLAIFIGQGDTTP